MVEPSTAKHCIPIQSSIKWDDNTALIFLQNIYIFKKSKTEVLVLWFRKRMVNMKVFALMLNVFNNHPD